MNITDISDGETPRHLDPQTRQQLLNCLTRLPNMETADSRRLLLKGIDREQLLQVAYSSIPLVELNNFIDWAEGYTDQYGQSGLLSLLDNAKDLAPGLQLAAQFDEMQSVIRNWLNSPGFVKPPAQPEAHGLYIAGQACQVEVDLLEKVTPSEDDLAYIRRITNIYKTYKPASYVNSKVIPLADFLPGEIVHRRVPDGAGASARLWSLCNTKEALLPGGRLLVLGRPGIGKTSLVQFLTWQIARLEDVTAPSGEKLPPALILPIAVSLRTWLDPPDQPDALLHFIVHSLAPPSDDSADSPGLQLVHKLDAYLNSPAQQARLVFLLDDYNRMPRDENYEQRVRAIRRFANTYDQAAIAVVSRSLYYDGRLDDCVPPFQVVELSPWGPSEIAAYLEHKEPDLLPYLNDPRLLSLADIPQQLEQFREVYHRQGLHPKDFFAGFPSPRDVLRAFVEALLDYSEREGRGEKALRGRVCQVLIRLATGLAQDQKTGSYVEYPQAVQYLGPDGTAADTRQLLEIACDANILDIDKELEVEQVGFEWQQLEEYFATSIREEAKPTGDNGLESNNATAIIQAASELLEQGPVRSNEPANTPA